MSDTYKLQPPAASPPPPPESASEKPERPPEPEPPAKAPPGRLVSLDAYRGFIMTMLAAGGFGIAAFANLESPNAVWQTWDYDVFQRLKFHFSHPDWESITGWIGVSFWDLIQPAFMFMVGVAMPFSYARRSTLGSSSRWRMLHALFRAVILTLMGVFLASLNQKQTNWMFTNVLAQIGLGYFFAYLLLSRSPQFQVGAVAVILVGYWGLFMVNPPPNYHHYEIVESSRDKGEVYEGQYAPWSKNANIGHYFDVWLLNKLRLPDNPSADLAEENAAPGFIRQWWFSSPKKYTHNRGGYVTLNFIPSIATTLLGILCGQLLLSDTTAGGKLIRLLLWGAVCLGLGFLAHHTVCPVIKRIWTPSWTLFSGGYVIWILAGFYFLFDILPFRKLAFPLVVVGMNSIVMYMMGQMLRPWVTEKIVRIHFARVLETFFGPDAMNSQGLGAMLAPTATFVVFWLIAYWLYRNRYFVRV